MAISFCEKNGLSIVGVRPFSVYGPWGRPDSDIYKISMSLDKNTPLEIPKTRFEYWKYKSCNEVHHVSLILILSLILMLQV